MHTSMLYIKVCYILFFIAELLLVGNEAFKFSCITDSDCNAEMALCVGNKCTCPPDFVFNSDMTACLPVSDGYGSFCSDHRQCSARLQSGGQCLPDRNTGNMTCQCKQGFHYLHGLCWQTAGLGIPCKNDVYCYSNYDFESTICGLYNVCQCAEGYYQREYSSCRRSSYAPRDSCGIFLDCKFDGAVCTMDRICAREDSPLTQSQDLSEKNERIQTKIPSANTKTNKSTVLVLKVGDTCTTSSDCREIAHSVCSKGGHCVCNLGYYKSHDLLDCLPELGSPCVSDDDCEGRYMMCRNSTICVCKTGYVARPDNQQCEKLSRNISWSCLYPEECSLFGDGGICVNKKCQCKNDTHFVAAQLYCWVTKDIGSSCKVDYDCYVTSGDGVACDNMTHTCKCLPGYHSADNNSDCRLDARQPNDPCVESADCLFPNAMCQEGYCGCKENYFVEPDNTCLPGLGGQCTYDYECVLNNTECEKGVCTCEPNYVKSKDYQKCLPEVTQYGGKCTEPVQCEEALGLAADCRGGICVCEMGHHYMHEHCYYNVPLGQHCSKNCECVESQEDTSERTVCVKGVCRCKPEFVYNEQNQRCDGSEKPYIHMGYILSVLLTLFAKWVP